MFVEFGDHVKRKLQKQETDGLKKNINYVVILVVTKALQPVPHSDQLYSSYVALFIERGCLSKMEIGERETYMHFDCM
jgi:hypothetical protein